MATAVLQQMYTKTVLNSYIDLLIKIIFIFNKIIYLKNVYWINVGKLMIGYKKNSIKEKFQNCSIQWRVRQTYIKESVQIIDFKFSQKSRRFLRGIIIM